MYHHCATCKATTWHNSIGKMLLYGEHVFGWECVACKKPPRPNMKTTELIHDEHGNLERERVVSQR